MRYTVPDCFLCPITREIMTDPVTLATDCGHAFDRASARDCLSKGYKACPVCRRPLRNYTFVPNHPLREAIEHFERSMKEREDEKLKAAGGAKRVDETVEDEEREPQNENSRAGSNGVRSTREAVEKPIVSKIVVSPAVHKPPKTEMAAASRPPMSPAVTKPPKVMAVVTKPPRNSNASKTSAGEKNSLRKPITFGRTYTY